MTEKSVISYFSEDTDFELADAEKHTDWLMNIAGNHDSEILSLTYIFCSDDYLLNINKSYLNHNYYTDIITFPYKQGAELESDIFISIDRVKDNATQAEVSFTDELHRVMAHGVLHLIGFGDKTVEEAKIMRAKEDESIALF